MAQPALSQAMAQLDLQGGVRLLGRRARGISLTPARSAFLEKARSAIAAADRAEGLAASWARGPTGRLTLGFLSLTPPFSVATWPPRSRACGQTSSSDGALGFPTHDPHA